LAVGIEALRLDVTTANPVLGRYYSERGLLVATQNAIVGTETARVAR
jgi:hypothetical protein